MSFGDFKGRKREKNRILKTLREFMHKDHLKFFKEQYDYMVPFHNHVHIGYGSLFILKREIPISKIMQVASLFQLWLGHDAGHNGNAAESPELKSAEIYHYNFRDRSWRAICDTQFPYYGPVQYGTTGRKLRTVDTLRPASGINAEPLFNCGVQNATPFQSFFFESGLYFLELKKEPLDWLTNGQQKFFFPQIRLAIAENDYAKNFPLYKKMTDMALDNESQLTRYLADAEGREKLLKAIGFLMNDVTLPEFIEFANGIGLR